MHKKKTDSYRISLACQSFVENIGFDRRKLIFGVAGIPLKIKHIFYSRNRLLR